MEHEPQTIEVIFEAFGGTTNFAQTLGEAVSTVDAWKNPRNGRPRIPRWRRRYILEAASRGEVELPAHAIAYLSDVRVAA